jgi:hypothetical protein
LGSVVFAEDRLKGTLNSDGKQAVAFALHGKTSCVLMDDKVFCAPAIAHKATVLAAPSSN